MPDSDTAPVEVHSLPELADRLRDAVDTWDKNTQGKQVRIEDVGRLLRIMVTALVIIADNALQDPKGDLAPEEPQPKHAGRGAPRAAPV